MGLWGHPRDTWKLYEYGPSLFLQESEQLCALGSSLFKALRWDCIWRQGLLGGNSLKIMVMRMGPLCIRVGVLEKRKRCTTDLSHYRQERDEDTGAHESCHLQTESSPQKTSQLLP